MTSHKFEGEVDKVSSMSRWMDEPHKKLLEPCPDCNGKVMISERRELFNPLDDREHYEYWYECDNCGQSLAFIEVTPENP